MAKLILGQLAAISKLLVALRGTPAFQQVVAAQGMSVETILAATKLQPCEAADICTALNAMDWPDADRNALLGSVARAVAVTPSPLSIASKMQNFESFQNYFVESQWVQLQAQGVTSDSKLHIITQQVSALGLRYPSEPTVQKLAGFFLLVTDGYEKITQMMPAIKLEASRLIKKKIKEYGKTSPHAFIQKLPEEPELFLHTFTRCVAFGNEKPVPCKISTDVLQASRASIPMRLTHKDVRQHSSGDHGSQQLQAVLAMLMQNMQQGASARGECSIQMVQQRPQRSLSFSSAGSSGSGGTRGVLQLEDLKEFSDQSPKPKPATIASEPLVSETPSPKLDGKRTVDETTNAILDAFAHRTADKVARKKPAAAKTPAAAEASPSPKCKPGAAKTSLKGKPKLTVATTPSAGKHCISVEWTRNQVLARTGKRGPGNNKAFKFDDDSQVVACKRKAATWLASQGCT